MCGITGWIKLDKNNAEPNSEAVLQAAEQQTGTTILAEMQRIADIGRGLTHQADASGPQPLLGDEYLEAYRKLAWAAIDGAHDIFRTRP